LWRPRQAEAQAAQRAEAQLPTVSLAVPLQGGRSLELPLKRVTPASDPWSGLAFAKRMHARLVAAVDEAAVPPSDAHCTDHTRCYNGTFRHGFNGAVHTSWTTHPAMQRTLRLKWGSLSCTVFTQNASTLLCAPDGALINQIGLLQVEFAGAGAGHIDSLTLSVGGQAVGVFGRSMGGDEGRVASS
jgi:hypothetical protein